VERSLAMGGEESPQQDGTRVCDVYGPGHLVTEDQDVNDQGERLGFVVGRPTQQ
jgi:hypothetical protein